MSLKLEESRISELSVLWSTVLSEPPPRNQSDLWKEHQQIRTTLNVIDGRPFSFREQFDRPGREESVAGLVKWLQDEGVDCSGVIIRPGEFGYGLHASRELKSESVPLDIPQKIMLSLDYGAECEQIQKMHASDSVLSSMSNVTLAIIVAYVVLTEDRRFTPYINSLPDSHATPLFFDEERLLSLKPSPVFESSLLMFRAVARHYVYFVLRVVRDSIVKKSQNKLDFDFRRSPFNSEKFTFDFYRWCVCTVSTRLNNLPSTEYKTANGTPMMIPALIPLVDFANYEAGERESSTMIFDAESQTVQLQLRKSVVKDEEICLDYGRRSHGDFLLHNGFVPVGRNEGNSYEIKFGFPKTPELAIKQKFLHTKKIQSERGVYSFCLSREVADRSDLTETALWQFALVFVAPDLETTESAENKTKAQKFLRQRLQLLQRSYGNLTEREDEAADSVSRFIWRLKRSELELLEFYEQKVNVLMP